MHMKDIYDTLAGIQSRLTSVDERLSPIEGNIFNIGMTTPQPGPSFSSPDVTLVVASRLFRNKSSAIVGDRL